MHGWNNTSQLQLPEKDSRHSVTLMTFDCGLSLLFLMNRQWYRLITEPLRNDDGGRGDPCSASLVSLFLIAENRIGRKEGRKEGRKQEEKSRPLVQVSGELELKESSNEIVCNPPSLSGGPPSDSRSAAVMQRESPIGCKWDCHKVLVTRFLSKRNLWFLHFRIISVPFAHSRNHQRARARAGLLTKGWRGNKRIEVEVLMEFEECLINVGMFYY